MDRRSILRATAMMLVPTLPAQTGQIVFTDVTAASGIHWVQQDDGTRMGAGCAFLDYDGDGRQDILLAGGIGSPALYRNLGGGSFAEVVPRPFPAPPGESFMCVTVADVDNDGDPDVFFGNWGLNRLYRNDGVGTFTDITTSLVAGRPDQFTTTAAFGDFDADGKLDLFIGHYIRQFSYPNHAGEPNQLLRGNGDGTFSDVTTPAVAGIGTALASTWTDFDGDGDVDIFLGNDFGAFIEPNRIHRNDGAGPGGWMFTECSAAVGAALRIYCMGIAVGDVDRDRNLDYYFTNLGRNVLLRRDAAGFTDVTDHTRTQLTHDPTTSPPLLATSWGCGFHDFDLDGWVDLYVSNGHIPSAPEIANGRATPNTLFRHDGPGMTFSQVPIPLDTGLGRGCAFADYDDDGDVDILQASVGGPPMLMRNDTPRTGSFLVARLRGRTSSRDALGARVEVDAGDFVACREVSRNYSFEASSQAAVHVGLGPTTRVREFDVRWPSGIAQQVFDVPTNLRLHLVEPIVTVSTEQLSFHRVAGGDLRLTYEVTLTNHSTAPQVAYHVAQVRVGYANRSNPMSGTTIWNEPPRTTRLGPGERFRASSVLTVAGSSPVPPSGLSFVWTVVDGDFGIDEARTAIEPPPP